MNRTLRKKGKIALIFLIMVLMIVASIIGLSINKKSAEVQASFEYTDSMNGLIWSYDRRENPDKEGEYFAVNVRLSTKNYLKENFIMPSEIVIPDTLDGNIVETVGMDVDAGNDVINNYWDCLVNSVEESEYQALAKGETEKFFSTDEYFYKCREYYERKIKRQKLFVGFTFGSGTANTEDSPLLNVKKVVMPNTVKEIKDFAFYGFKNLEEVVLSENVEDIGRFAFGDCNNLKTVKSKGVSENTTGLILPTSITSVKEGAFSNTTNLSRVVLNEGITGISNSVFYRSGIESVNIPNSVSEIEREAFKLCSNLNSIDIEPANSQMKKIGSEAFYKTGNISFYLPNSVTTIEVYAFGKSKISELKINPEESSLVSVGGAAFTDTDLKEIYLPATLESIGDSVFSGCRELKSAVINSDNIQIADEMFKDCEKLESVTLKEGITTVGNSAFYNCKVLKGIALPSTITTIGNKTFELSGLTTITIPNTVLSIGKEVFKNSRCLESVTISTGIDNIPEKAFFGCNSLNKVVIPDNIIAINEYAFCGCSGLSTIELGENLETIKKYAFSECVSLKNINIPGKVLNLENYIFDRCTALKDVIINEGTTTISRYTFNKCDSMQQVNIPESVTTIEDYAFLELISLSTIVVAEENANYVTVDNILYNSDKTTLIHCPRAKEGQVSIEETVTEIFSKAFYKCNHVTGGIVIPNSVVNIGEQAFYKATGFNGELVLGENVENIKDSAFEGASNLKGGITIPNSVNVIGKKAFHGCTGFNGVLNLGTGVHEIGSKAFASLNLTGVLHIPDSVTKIGAFAFNSDMGINALTFGSGLTQIEEGTFFMCTGIDGNIEIKSPISKIGRQAFYGCSKIDSIQIPNSVDYIGGETFENCQDLKDIYIDKAREDITFENQEKYAQRIYMHYINCKHTVTIDEMPEGVNIVNELGENIRSKEVNCGESLSYKIVGDNIAKVSVKIIKQGDFVDEPQIEECLELTKDSVYTLGPIDRNITVRVYVENLGRLTVNYKDKAGNKIAGPDILQGIKGEHFVVERKEISGYLPVEPNIANYTGDFVSGDSVYTFVYGKKSANVKIKCVDKYQNELIDSQIIYGIIGDGYSTIRPEIAGYTAYGEEPINATGVYSEEEINVTYMYASIIKGLYTSNVNKKIIVTVENEPEREKKKAEFDVELTKIEKDSKQIINGTEFSVEQVKEDENGYIAVDKTKKEGLFTGVVEGNTTNDGKIKLVSKETVGEDNKLYDLSKIYKIVEENPTDGYTIGIKEFILKVTIGKENEEYVNGKIEANIVAVKRVDSNEYVPYDVNNMPEVRVEVSENNLVKVIVENSIASKKAQFKVNIVKVRNNVEKTPLENANFTFDSFENGGRNVICNGNTDKNGIINAISTSETVFEGKSKTYIIEEKSAPIGYIGIEYPLELVVSVNNKGELDAKVTVLDKDKKLSDTQLENAQKPIHVDIDRNNLITVTVENSKELKQEKYSMQIRKKESNTGKSIAGAVFKVEELDGSNKVISTIDNLTTVEDGLATIILKENVQTVIEESCRRYRITEVSAPTKYVELTSPIIIELSVNSETGKLEIKTEAENKDSTGAVAIDKVSYEVEQDNNIILNIKNDLEQTGFALELAKVNKDNFAELLGGAKFSIERISTLSEEKISNFVTKQNEMIQLVSSKDVVAGDIYRYSIKEITEPEGYRRFIYEIIISVEVTNEMKIVPKIEAIRFSENGELLDVTDAKNNPISDLLYRTIFEKYISVTTQNNNPNSIVLLVANEKVDFDLNMKVSIAGINETDLSKNIAKARVENNIVVYDKGTNTEFVQKGNIVKYNLRAFNEGNIGGSIDEMIIELPEGVKFIPERPANANWKMYKKVDNQFVSTNNKEEATMIKTTTFAKEGTEHTVLEPMNTTIDYAEAFVELEVTAENSSNIVIENFATAISSKDSNNTNNTDSASVKLKNFNLSIKKFIATVKTDDKIQTYDRKPDVKVEDDGKVVYQTESKAVPVYVDTASEITYEMRIYNEDTIDGTASEIIESIPEGLTFAEKNETNIKYGWEMYTDEDSDGKLEIVDKAEDATIIKTNYLENKTIEAFDPTTMEQPDYAEVDVVLKVTETDTSKMLKAISAITAASDKETTLEDNIDDEKIKLLTTDLAVVKKVSAVDGKKIVTGEPKIIYNDGKVTINKPTEITKVENRQKVEYSLRVYNIGSADAYGTTVRDVIPEGLTFLPEDETNKNNKWKMYTETTGKDGKKELVETTDVDKATMIQTEKIAEKIPENLIPGYRQEERQVPEYREVIAVFEINENEVKNETRLVGNSANININESNGDYSKENDTDIEYVYVKYFDLKIDKWIKTITTDDGEICKTTTYDKQNEKDVIAKVDVKEKNLDSMGVKVDYVMTVTNTGEIAGAAKEIVDYLPEGFIFNPEENPGWKLESGVLRKDLSNVILQAGESADVTLSLTWARGEINLGEKVNSAEIVGVENNASARDVNEQNNKDEAIAIFTIQTNVEVINIALVATIVFSLTLLTGGVVLIKKYII